MSDDALDRDWKPNGRRPQSTIARSFSQELMDIFRIENSISDLDQQVDQRRQNVDKNAQELASIEKRIREMEARLNRDKHPRPAISQHITGADTTSSSSPAAAAPRSLNEDKDEKAHSSRPGTARAAQPAPGSGIMPPTPGASEDGDHYRE